MSRWILDESGEPVEEPDLMTWAAWIESADSARRVALETVCPGVEVSTVFLGLDHNFQERGAPVLWETMVFRNDDGDEMDRCCGKRADALAMHRRMVQRIKDAIPAA